MSDCETTETLTLGRWTTDPAPLARLLLMPGPGLSPSDFGLATAPSDAVGYCKPVLCRDDAIDPEASYWTTNACWRQGTFVRRKNEDIAAFQAIYADIDFREDGPSRDDWVERVAAALSGLALPLPSWWLHSGRGLWAFWMIGHPDDLSKPHSMLHRKALSTGYQLSVYDDVAQGLVARLTEAGLPVDTGSRNPSRLSRIPGTANPRSDATVAWQPLDLQYRHKLTDLGRSVYGENWSVSEQGSKTPPKGSVSGHGPDTVVGVPAVAARLRKQARTRLHGLFRLAQEHGGPVQSQRHYALRTLANLCVRAQLPRDEAERLAVELARSCRPPEGDAKARRQIQWAFKNPDSATRHPPTSNGSIAEYFGVTLTEVDLAMGGAQAVLRRQRRAARRKGSAGAGFRLISKVDQVLRLLDRHPHLAGRSCRQLVDDVFQAEGLVVSHDTTAKAKQAYREQEGRWRTNGATIERMDTDGSE